MPGGLALCVKIHVSGGFAGCGFTEIEKGGSAIGLANQHEAAAADIAGRRMRYRQREADRNGSVHGISALLQNGKTHVGRKGLLRHYHAVFCLHRRLCCSLLCNGERRAE